MKIYALYEFEKLLRIESLIKNRVTAFSKRFQTDAFPAKWGFFGVALCISS